MKGKIYTQEKCSACAGTLKFDENRAGFFCKNHPEFKIIPEKCRVKFGRNVSKVFSKHRLDRAQRYLTGLRFKTDEKSFDARDYSSKNPLSFENQAERWLKHKSKSGISTSHLRNITRDINKCIAVWGPENVKTIQFAEIQDFLDDLTAIKKDTELSGKSKAEMRSVINQFFTWLCRREKTIPMPDIPEVKFELGWRNIIGVDLQQAILEEIRRISWDVNPKIWIGIKWLCTYIAFRPNELRNLKEHQINVSGFFVVPKDKEKDPKLISILEDDIELYNSHRGMPNLFFFRHRKGNGAAAPGGQFGKDYFYKWWKRACANLRVEGVDLYGGTRHSTATALGEHFSESEIMEAGSMHKTNKAARRYIQAQKNKSEAIYQKVAEMQKQTVEIVPLRKKS